MTLSQDGLLRVHPDEEVDACVAGPDGTPVTRHDYRLFTPPAAYPGASRDQSFRCVWCHGVACGSPTQSDPCWEVYHHTTEHHSRAGVRWPIGGDRPNVPTP